jgi:hypothetical protein
VTDLQSKEFQDRCRALSAELDALLAHPECEAILHNDWLHDQCLPVPSIELIRYFECRIFTGHGNDLMAETNDRHALVSYLVGEFQNEPPAERAASIPRILQRLDCFKYLNTGKSGASDSFIHEWLPIVSPFLESPRADGRRILARGFLETLTLRAIHTRDHARIHSLAKAVRIITHGEDAPQSVENRVKGEILRALPYLSEELEYCPSRSEIRCFITERARVTGEEPFSEENRVPWSKAFKSLGYPAEPRKIRMPGTLEANRIVALARKSAKA